MNKHLLEKTLPVVMVLCLLSLALLPAPRSVPWLGTALAQESSDSAQPAAALSTTNNPQPTTPSPASSASSTSPSPQPTTNNPFTSPKPTGEGGEPIISAPPTAQPTTNNPQPTTLSPTLPTLAPTTSNQQPTTTQSSARIRKPMKLRALAKRNLLANEALVARLQNAYDDDRAVISVRHANGEQLPVGMETVTEGDDKIVKIRPPRRFRPGRYTLQVSDITGIVQTEEFIWGVLAINPDKSIYAPGEQSHIAIAVLDDGGMMVCDAYTKLEITSPGGTLTTLGTFDGTIRINPECKIRDFTIRPDYETDYAIGAETGTYTMKLTAETGNGSHTVTDAFDVRRESPFDVKRIGPTRIFPIKKYPMRMVIRAARDFTGTITETVPADFIIEPDTGEDIRSYDRIASMSAATNTPAILGAPAPHLSYPFAGSFPQTLGYGENPDNEAIQAHYKKFGLPAHDGIDFAVPQGTPLIAVDDGEIIMAGQGPYGITVIIKHDWGKSYYGHLSKTELNIGQNVSKGEEIGLSGNTGVTTGPHVHFSIRPETSDINNGFFGKVDPLPFLTTPIADGSVLSSFATVVQSKELIWDVSIKKGETVTLGYRFDAPDISPQFYLLGPLRLESSSQNVIPAQGGTGQYLPQAGIQIQSESTDSNNSTESASPESIPGLTLSLPSAPSVASLSSKLTTNNSQSFDEIYPEATGGAQGKQSNNQAIQQSNNGTIFSETRQWQIAADGDVTIDASVGQAILSHKNKPRMAFTSDQIGYTFYVNTGGTNYAYVKTTNGGASNWGGETVIDSGSIAADASITVWYDQWTPGDFGNNIHIMMLDTNAADVYYERIDTGNSDAQLGEYIVDNTPTTITRPDELSISKSTTNIVFMVFSDNEAGRDIRQCNMSSSCDNTNDDWTNAGTTPLDPASDSVVIMPLRGGKMLLVRDDISAEDIDYRIWDQTNWNGVNGTNVWTDIDTDAPDNTNYKHAIAASIRRWNNNIYLGYVANVGNVDIGDLRTAVYDGTGFTAKTEVVSNVTIYNLDMAVDEESGEVYASYTRGTSNTALNVYYKKSVDGMNTWGNEAQLNTTNTNLANFYTWMNVVDSERLYYGYIEQASWDYYGGTIVDLDPPVLEEIMRHGEWWSRVGKRKYFTF